MDIQEIKKLKPGKYAVLELDASFGHLRDKVEPQLMAFANSTEGIGFIRASQFLILRGDFPELEIEVPKSAAEYPTLRIPYRPAQDVVVYRSMSLPVAPQRTGEMWGIDPFSDSISGSHARGLVKAG